MTRPHAMAIEDMRRHLYTLRDHLPMFVIATHPSDYPDFYVARLWRTLPAAEVTPVVIMSRDLDSLRETMEQLGLVKLDRSPRDPDVITETWL